MKGTTIITGRNQFNEVIIRLEAPYEKRFEAINKAIDTEEVTHVTTRTIFEKRG